MGTDQTNEPVASTTKTRNHTKVKVSKPECNSGRAERAGGRSCSDCSRTKHSLLSRHGRTSRTVAHGNLSCICVYPYGFTRVICEYYDERVLILELDHQREEITCISRRVVCSYRTKKRGGDIVTNSIATPSGSLALEGGNPRSVCHFFNRASL